VTHFENPFHSIFAFDAQGTSLSQSHTIHSPKPQRTNAEIEIAVLHSSTLFRRSPSVVTLPIYLDPPVMSAFHPLRTLDPSAKLI
jgi:hypothetical protein